jgi:hypothetical protein
MENDHVAPCLETPTSGHPRCRLSHGAAQGAGKRYTFGLLAAYRCHHKCPAKAQYSLFMEPSSVSRRKRGRPKVFSERELSDAGGRSALSHRHLQNRAYAQRARQRLAGLWWWEVLSKGRSIPQGVLIELGRIEDSAKFQEAAWWYLSSARGLAAKTAAAKIKQMRTGKTPQEGPATLYEHLMKVIKDFRISYPDASLLYVEGQIKLALDTVRRFQRHRF